MSWIPPATIESEYSADDWRLDTDEDYEFLGERAGDGRPVFFDSDTNSVYLADVDEAAQRVIPDTDGDGELNPGETLGEYLERIGEETGWDSLSQFAREHLEDDDTQT